MNEQQEKRGPGRPSQGKQRRYFTLSPDTTKMIDNMPPGERSGFVDQAIREKGKRNANGQSEATENY